MWCPLDASSLMQPDVVDPFRRCETSVRLWNRRLGYGMGEIVDDRHLSFPTLPGAPRHRRGCRARLSRRLAPTTDSVSTLLMLLPPTGRRSWRSPVRVSWVQLRGEATWGDLGGSGEFRFLRLLDIGVTQPSLISSLMGWIAMAWASELALASVTEASGIQAPSSGTPGKR